MRPRSLVALYHAVGTPADTGYRDALPLAALERQLAWLRRHYRVLPLAELLARRALSLPLDGLAALTFDDNHRSVGELALPLAASMALPATWFLIGGPLQGQPFWRDLVHRLEVTGQVEAFLDFARDRSPAAARLRGERFYRDSKDPARIASSEIIPLLRAFLPDAGPPAAFITHTGFRPSPPPGITLASHTENHPVLAGLPAALQQSEIEAGLAALKLLPWPRSRALALPFGGPGSYDAATLAAARDCALDGLLLTADAPQAADDFAEHPLAAGSRLPLLVRDLPGRWPPERFA